MLSFKALNSEARKGYMMAAGVLKQVLSNCPNSAELAYRLIRNMISTGTIDENEFSIKHFHEESERERSEYLIYKGLWRQIEQRDQKIEILQQELNAKKK